MRTFAASDRWKQRWPGAVVGCLVVDAVANPPESPALNERLTDIERDLRERYAGFDRAALRATAPFDAYGRYYKAFGQNYHVLHQVESIALKGKPIPRRAALVEAAFAEELRSGVLTAMHDADAIGPQIQTDAATGTETVALYNGKSVDLDEGDMFMRDERGILTSVIRGPAAYGLVTPQTTRVAVCVYAPEGIAAEAVTQHLEAIAANMRLIAPDAPIELLEVIEG
jgi:DNA/RNA-binding domain of Phe-tRNA-synthetase-like protein